MEAGGEVGLSLIKVPIRENTGNGGRWGGRASTDQLERILVMEVGGEVGLPLINQKEYWQWR